MSLTPEQIAIIKVTVPIVAEHGLTVTKAFYKKMIDENSELKDVFNHTHQATGHQPQTLANAVYAYAANIDNLGALTGAVERICQKHASLYIKESQYAIVGKYLIGAFKEVLGDAFTKEIEDAWGAAYWQLANLMINREKQLYQQGGEWQDWREFVLDKKVKESDEITSFYWKSKDGKPLPEHLPGQYISVRMFVPEYNHLQPRQYSVSSAPNKEYYRISVKKDAGVGLDEAGKSISGWISNKLHADYKEGDTIEISHPYGDFFFDAKKNANGPVTLISAGVGLTPLLSMLESFVAAKSERKVTWVHTTRSSTAQAFGGRVQEIVKNHSNVHAVVFNKSPSGDNVYNFTERFTVEKLDKENDLFLSDKTAEYYICGPEAFMKQTAEKLKGLGVEESRIKYEMFTSS